MSGRKERGEGGGWDNDEDRADMASAGGEHDCVARGVYGARSEANHETSCVKCGRFNE